MRRASSRTGGTGTTARRRRQQASMRRSISISRREGADRSGAKASIVSAVIRAFEGASDRTAGTVRVMVQPAVDFRKSMEGWPHWLRPMRWGPPVLRDGLLFRAKRGRSGES